MIELIGVGVTSDDGGRRLHRVCARFNRGDVTMVISRRTEERDALLDAVAARIVPEEGRVWVGRVPVSRDTVRRIRGLVTEVDVRARPVARRSLLWNVLVSGTLGRRALETLLRLPRASERRAARDALERVGLGRREIAGASGLIPLDRARVAIAAALVRKPDALIVREIDSGLDGADGTIVRMVLQSLARHERLAVLVSAATPAVAVGFADRLVALADGRLVFDGLPTEFRAEHVKRPLGIA